MTGKRKRNTDEDGKEDLRGEVRRLRKQVAQLKRELEKANGVLNWGFLLDVEKKPSEVTGKGRASKPAKSKEVNKEVDSANKCPKCPESVIVLKRPDGSVLTKCSSCRYRKVEASDKYRKVTKK